MTARDETQAPGLVIMLGSGETAASIRKIYDWLFSQMPKPVKVSILETPAGFEPNSAYVARRIAEFLTHRLQNFEPDVTVVPARKRQTQFSPDDPDILRPLLQTDVMFMGPGSPTYAIRQLQDTLAWHMLVARHCLGSSLVLASASTLAMSAYTLPVYEIYKVGEELHWYQGLDFFGPFGLSLVFVPHWNNVEGGAELDTSRCYMGLERFEGLLNMLPPQQTVVGIDEHTALVFDLHNRRCRVMGNGGVTSIRGGSQQKFAAGQQFDIMELGPFNVPERNTLVPANVWDMVLAAQQEVTLPVEPSSEVLQLAELRGAARARRNWEVADQLREQIMALGWYVKDTPQGFQLEPIAE